MTFTVLFDLDDTLIRNEMGVFLPAYFTLIQEAFADLAAPEKLMPIFMTATQRMLANDRADRTLADAFLGHFLPGTNISLEELQRRTDVFYSQRYPALSSLTGVVPAAQGVVATLADRGYRLAVTTNPLFPQVAADERLRWAQIEVPDAFEFVTAYETFHFAKPSPAYYAEVLAYLGWPEGPVVVVGNDPLNDIAAAGRLGLATYQVSGSDPVAGRPGNGVVHGYGDIAELVAWLDDIEAERLVPDYASRDAVLAVIQSTAAALDTFARLHPPAAWDVRIGEAWTPREVLHHLRDVEAKVNLPRLAAFETTENPFISGVDTDSWHRDGFHDLSALDEVLAEFLSLRLDLIDRLKAMSEADWDLPARHAIFGPTHLGEIMRIIAGHDRLHIRQLREVLSGP